jgi:hypothetical protein
LATRGAPPRAIQELAGNQDLTNEVGPPVLQLVIREVSKTYPNGVQALKDVTLMARRRFTRPTAGAAAAAVALILTVGGFIFYNTNVLNAYRSASDTIHRQLRFEVHLEPMASATAEPMPPSSRTGPTSRI